MKDFDGISLTNFIRLGNHAMFNSIQNIKTFKLVGYILLSPFAQNFELVQILQEISKERTD